MALPDVYQTLQTFLGSVYVNDFNFLGRAWQVNVQGDAPFRNDAEALRRLWTRNADGQMVPLAALVSASPTVGPDPLGRYNGHVAADLSGAPAPGVSSGEAVAAMATAPMLIPIRLARPIRVRSRPSSHRLPCAPTAAGDTCLRRSLPAGHRCLA